MRTVSIRTALQWNIIALVLLMSATLLIVTVFGARRSIHDLSERLIVQSSAQADEQLESFFGSIEKLLFASRSWWESGLINYRQPADIEDLNALFIPVLNANPQVTSMMLVNDAGLEYLLFRDLRGGAAYEWYNRLVLADEGPEAGYEMLWTTEGELYRQGPLPDDARDYDPRKRPFYRDPPYDEAYWTQPYYFFITKDAGMTACYKWRDDTTGQTRLAAFDLLLMDLSKFTSGLRPSPEGKTFVLLNDGSLLGLPRDDRWGEDSQVRDALRNPGERSGGVTRVDLNAQLLTPGDFGLSTVSDAWEHLGEVGRDVASHFRFTSEGESWWGGFTPYRLAGQTLWVGVVVPEEDFLPAIRRQRNVILAITASALLVGVIIAGIMARRFGQPLELLAEQSSRVRELQLSDQEHIQSGLTEVQQLADANAQMVTALDSFARYVPIDLVRELLRREEVAKIGGRVQTLTILFTDIEGFTSLAEQLEPDKLTMHMAEYFSSMLEVLGEEQATVDKFIGDAIVAFWGAPRPNEAHAKHAVREVLRASARLDEMNAAWVRDGVPALRTRFGLNTGDAVVGNMGAPERLNYTVLGDSVNMASRLESLNRVYGTVALATQAVVDSVDGEFVWRRVDRVIVKGKTEAVDIYEPFGETGEVSAENLKLKERFETALGHYLRGAFGEAMRHLESLVADYPEDAVSPHLLEVVRELMEAPPEGWDGATHFAEK